MEAPIRVTQQEQVYAAERNLDLGHEFKTIDEARAFVDQLREQWWWDYFYEKIEDVEVHPIRARRSQAHWDEHERAGMIELAPHGRNVKTITHELAHVVAGALRGSSAHDPAYARTYACLTYLISGSDAWLQLQASFDAHGVDYMQ